MDYTKNFETQFRPLQLIEDFYPRYIDPEYGSGPYWDNELYDKQTFQVRHDDYPPTDDEEDPEILDTKLPRVLIELWQTNSEAYYTEKIAKHQEQQIY